VEERYLPTQKEVKNKDTIKEINNYNKDILNFQSNVSCTVQKGFLRTTLTGDVNYIKDKKFRLILKGRQKEVDIGSNTDQYWFWSRQMNDCALYYASHQDRFENTRLKPIFHPLWIVKVLNIDEIADSYVEEYKNDKLRIVYKDKKTIKCILIDKYKKRIIGYYLYNDNKLLTSMEIEKFVVINNKEVISKVKILWHEEGIVLTWELTNQKINCDIDQGSFLMPTNIHPKIDMTKD
jgi:flavodoxin